MDSSDEDLCIQKIESLVFDEDKIVTVPIIAKQLGLSSVDATELLRKFLKNQRQVRPDDLSATYIISGKNENGFKCIIAPEAEIETKKTKFKSVSSHVIYSVQKNKNVDLNIIALAQKLDELETEPVNGSVVSENCVKRILTEKVLPPPSAPKVVDKLKGSNLFKNVPAKAKSEEMPATSSNAKPTAKKNETKKGAGISSFFGKATSKSCDTITTKDNLQKPVNVSPEPKKDVKKNSSDDEMEINVDQVEPVKETKIEKTNGVKADEKENDKNKKKRQRSNSRKTTPKEDKQILKRRKRIVEQSDSEDDMFAKEEDNEEKIHSDPEEIPMVTREAQPLAPKNKKRKAVDKTYVDDEGFVVTRTEYIYESASEEEEIKEPPKEKPKPILAPSVSPKGPKGKKGKKTPSANQPTLMNFFKKK